MRALAPPEVGQRFGRWTVIIPETRTPDGCHRASECRCDCGTVDVVRIRGLLSGHNKSCGCLKAVHLADWVNSPENAERLRALHQDPGFRQQRAEMFQSAEYRSKLPKPSLTHGLSEHPLYGTWRGMIYRCDNPGSSIYAYYGGRGIQVCAEWHDVAAFIAWIEANLGPRPEGMTLDRIDNDGNYEPRNVRWATKAEQAANRRKRSADRAA